MKRNTSLALVVAFSVAFCGFGSGEEPAKCSIVKQAESGKPADYVLENGFLQVVVSPNKGGGIKSLVHKPGGAKLSIPPGESRGDPSFMDRVYCQYPEQDKTVVEFEYFVSYPYSAEIIKDTPEEVALKLSCRSRSERLGPWLTLVKIYTLKRNESALTVQHVLENGSAKTGRAGIWVTTFLRSAGDAFSECNNYYSPTTNGIRKIRHPGKDVSQQGDWVLNPPLNWKAVIGDSSGRGIVAIFDCPYLSCFYDWYLTSGFISTFEWVIREQEIKAQDKFATKCVIMPVVDFQRVDNVIADKIACGINLPEKRINAGDDADVQVSLNAFANVKARLILRLIGAQGAKELLAKDMDLKAGTTVIARQAVKFEKEGACKLEVELTESGKSIGKALRPLAIGNAEADYKIAPLAVARVGNEFVFPLEQKGLPGGDKIIVKNAAMADSGGVAAKQGNADSALDTVEVLTQDADFVNEAPLNFTRLIKAKKMPGVFDENSVKVMEVDQAGKDIKQIPCNFIKHGNYNKENFAAGGVLFKVGKREGKKGEKTPVSRYYRIGFDMEGAGKEKQAYDSSLQEPNLVNLGGFEETDKSIYAKEGWEGEVTPVEEAAHSGKRAFKFTMAPGKTQNGRGVNSPRFQVRPGEQYNIVVWAKAKGAHSTLWAFAAHYCFYDQNGKFIEQQGLADIRDATFDWRKIEQVVNIPEGVSSMMLTFGTRAKEGNIYVDDISINSLPKLGLAMTDNKIRTEQMYPCLDYYFAISDKFETPHVKWLKPSAAGKIKVLYANYMKYITATTKRQVIEFAQRMDLDYTYLPLLKRMTHPSSMLGMTSGDTYADDLEQYIVDLLGAETAKDYAVTVVQGLDFKGVQQEVLEMLLNEARKGKGLVLLDCRNLPAEIMKIMDQGKAVIPPNFYAVPDDVGGGAKAQIRVSAICRLACLDKGRVALVTMPGNFPTYPNYYGREVPYWEYMLIPAMKTIVWASDVKSGATVDKFAFQDGALNAEVNSSVAQDAALEVSFRDEYGQTDAVAKKSVKLLPGKNELKVDLPQMRAGFHLADYRLLNNAGQVFDFGSYSFATPLGAGIADIAFDREYYRTGEEIKARIALTNIPAGSKLVGEVEDTWNRRIKKMEIDLAAGQVEAVLAFKLEKPLTILHRLFVRVVQDGNVAVQKMGEFSLPFNYPPDDELMAYVWYGQAQGLKAWADNGFDNMIVSFSQDKRCGIYQAVCNMNMRPYGYGTEYLFKDSKDERKYHGDASDDLIREPCLSNPERWKRIGDRINEIMKKNNYIYYGIRDYQLTDEMYLGAKVCVSPWCLAEFQKYLRSKYKDLTALNREWQSNFQNWDEVKPDQLSEVSDEKGNLPRWLDHRMFMNLVFANFIAEYKKIIGNVYPEAKVGLSGTGNPGITFNWWEDMKHMDCLANYGGIQCDLINSFQLPGARTGGWTGGYVPTEKDCEKYEIYHPWSGVLNGNRAYMFFHASVVGTVLAGDLTFTQNGLYAVREIKELKAGIAKMLFSSDRMLDGVAMHYSQSSMFAANATIGREYWAGALDSWKYLLNDLGLNFNFISYEQLENGKLDNAKYKVFILPVSLSLSAGEVEALREFVRKGGVVLADYAPGIYDEHGKKCANAGLLELFGMKRADASRVSLRECRMQIKSNEAEGIKPRELPVRYGEDGLELGSGKAFGETGNPAAPGIIINRFGKGKAVLLNCVFSDYAKLTLGGEGGETSQLGRGDPLLTMPFKELVSDVLEGCGIKRAVVIKTKQGEDFQLLAQTIRHAAGPIRYVGIMKQPANYVEKVKPSDYVPVDIAFDKEGYIYDVREGKYVGKGASLETTIAPSVAKVYAILPYKVKKIVLDPPRSCRAGDVVKIPVKIKTGGGPAGNHIIHVEVCGPDQKPRGYYAQNIKLEGGTGAIELGTALNDTKGQWEITVKDTATGVQGQCGLELK